MDMTIITTAIASAKAAKEFLQAAASLKVDNETLGRINDALNEVARLQEKLFEAREQLFNLQEQNSQLREQVKAHDDWKTRLDEFVLTKTVGGAIVYESRTDTPKHYVCPLCIEKHQIQILQDIPTSGSFWCPSCKTHYQIGERISNRLKIRRRRTKSWRSIVGTAVRTGQPTMWASFDDLHGKTLPRA